MNVRRFMPSPPSGPLFPRYFICREPTAFASFRELDNLPYLSRQEV